MSFALRPTLTALLRNRSAPLLVAMQIAIALAVLVNGLYIVHQKIEKTDRPTLIDENNLFGLQSEPFTQHFDYDATLHEDLAYLRSLPGVVDVTPSNSVPLSLNGRGDGFSTLPHDKGNIADANIYEMDDHAINTLGVKLLAGRNFRADEVLPPDTHSFITPQVIVTQALAQRLFPHENALGRTIYDGTESGTIIGIVADMIGIGWWGFESPVQVAIYPQRPQARNYSYLVRTAAGQRDALMRQVEDHLAGSNQDRVIHEVRSVEEYKQLLYATDRGIGLFLTAVTVLMLAVASLGIFSLATFNVSTRTRQIGTRRAVGARRRDIVRYFLVENGLITAAGVVLGCLLALGIGLWLSSAYSLPRLDLFYLVGGVLVILIVAQLAAWWPARRAASVPPSVATRTI